MKVSMNPLTRQDVQTALLAGTVERLASQTLTSGAGAEGAYVQLDASTASEVMWLIICLYNQSVNVEFQIEIATGASGSEVPLIDDLIVYGNGVVTGIIYQFPVEIAAGTRLAARVQGTNAGDSLQIAVWLVRN